MHTTEAIHAAGGIVMRRGEQGAAEVAVVWRETRGDWTFPKGKLDVGETYEQAGNGIEQAAHAGGGRAGGARVDHPGDHLAFGGVGGGHRGEQGIPLDARGAE